MSNYDCECGGKLRYYGQPPEGPETFMCDKCGKIVEGGYTTPPKYRELDQEDGQMKPPTEKQALESVLFGIEHYPRGSHAWKQAYYRLQEIRDREGEDKEESE